MASEKDVILLSCLTKAPAAGEATFAVRSALQRVIVRAPSAMIHDAGRGRQRPAVTTAAAAPAGTAPHLCAICPSAHTAIVDCKLLRAFTAARARAILAGLSPLPAAAGAHELPTVVAGVAGGPSGLCFLGQRATSEGYSAFTIRRETESESGETAEEHQALRIDDLMHEYGGRAQASARALYDLVGSSNGDVLGGVLEDGAKSCPFARLATEWDCTSHAARTLGSPPPPACSSLLFVGGTCPSGVVSLAIRADIETLSTAAAAGLVVLPHTARRKAKGPFGGGVGNIGEVGADAGVEGDARAKLNQQDQTSWHEDLQALLNGSENMAELASKPRDGHSTASEDDEGSDGRARQDEDDTALQQRQGAGGVGAEEDVGAKIDEETRKFRGDLDFSERLWELAARAVNVEGVRLALKLAFNAVGDGHIFPVVSRDNKTAIGCHIRDGVVMAREARYHDAGSVGVGVPRDGAKLKAWQEVGSAMVTSTTALVDAFVELGVHKVKRDLVHWLEVSAGVLAADIDRDFPTVSTNKPVGIDPAEERTTALPLPSPDRRLDRLVTLANTLDLAALAQSYGAPWRQVRALAHTSLATLGRAAAAPDTSATAGSSSLLPLPVFSVGLPMPIPPRARSNLAHPVFWELLLKPVGSTGSESAGIDLASATDSVSYVLATADIFQLNGVNEPPMFSGSAARAAQAALEGCPAHLVPEVLSSVAGVQSFLELKRRQQKRRSTGATVGEDTTALFVCEHIFTPW